MYTCSGLGEAQLAFAGMESCCWHKEELHKVQVLEDVARPVHRKPRPSNKSFHSFTSMEDGEWCTLSRTSMMSMRCLLQTYRCCISVVLREPFFLGCFKGQPKVNHNLCWFPYLDSNTGLCWDRMPYAIGILKGEAVGHPNGVQFAFCSPMTSGEAKGAGKNRQFISFHFLKGSDSGVLLDFRPAWQWVYVSC